MNHTHERLSTASAGAPAPRHREWRLGMLPAVLVCSVGLACLAAGCGRRDAGGGAIADAAPAEAPTLAQFCGQVIGQENAPLRIEALLPATTGCQDGIGLYLIGLAQAHPSWFRVLALDMRSDAARAIMQERGVKCAAIFVNAETRFDLGGEDGKVLLEGPMEPMDLYRVLVAKLAASGGGDLALPVPVDVCGPSEEQRRKAGF